MTLNGFGFGKNPQKKKRRQPSLQEVLIAEKMKLVRKFIESGQGSLAEVELTELHKKFPEDNSIMREITSLWNNTSRHSLTLEALNLCGDIDHLPPGLLFNFASANQAHGLLIDAVCFYQRVLSIEPANHSALCNLANCYREQGELRLARQAISEAIGLCEAPAHYFYNKALICIDQKDWDPALQALNKALLLEPGYQEARHNLAKVFYFQKKLKNALDQIDTLLCDHPDWSEAGITKGLILFDLGQRTESLQLFQSLWNVGNRSLPVFNNLAIHAVLDGRLEDAKIFYNSALQNWPNDASLKTDLATVLLALGDYEEGFDLYENRHLTNREGAMPIVTPNIPRWNTNNDSDFAHVLIVGEQGLGDTLQFIRYVTLLKEKGVTCTCLVQPPLVQLLKQSAIADQVLSVDACHDVDAFDAWIPLLSLPHFFAVREKNVLISAPYLNVGNDLVNRWRQRFASSSSSKRRIALNWSGNVGVESTFLKGRSFALNLLKPIFSASNQIEFISLQKGDGAEQLPELLEHNSAVASCFTALQSEIDTIFDFHETAAILLNTDLLITNDTAMAHLSGALGHPTWLLLKKSADWRWGLTGQETVWYPSVRLFRQAIEGDWSNVVDYVRDAIQEERF